MRSHRVFHTGDCLAAVCSRDGEWLTLDGVDVYPVVAVTRTVLVGVDILHIALTIVISVLCRIAVRVRNGSWIQRLTQMIGYGWQCGRSDSLTDT